MRRQRLFGLILMVWLMGLAGLSYADSCSYRTRITYSDGSEGCLSELPSANQTSKIWGRTIDHVAQTSTFYLVVAASSCTNAEIFSTNDNYPSSVANLRNGIVASAKKYIASCPKECDCTVVVDNGKVLLPRSLAMALGTGGGTQTTGAASPSQMQERLNAEKRQVEEKYLQERLLLQSQALQREQQLRAEVESLRNQRKFEEEARVQEQLKLAQEANARSDERLAREAAEKERSRLAELQRGQELARVEQDERKKDRELLLQLSAELTRLRAEAAAVAAASVNTTSANPTVSEVQGPAPLYANRKALVMGNDSYRAVPKLENAREDARLMAQSLTQVGYQVTLKLDLTEKDMKAALRSFKNQVGAGDEVAIFYAGHGVQLANSNYLIPIDVAGQDEEQIKDEGIALQRLLDDMSDKKAKLTLALIDACRDNPFKSNGRALGGGGRGLAPTTAATGQMVVFSAGSGQQALDKLGPSDKDKNGLFTRIFAREMQKSSVTIDRVVRSVRSEVVKLARSVGHDQVPAIYDQVVGEFYFRR